MDTLAILKDLIKIIQTPNNDKVKELKNLITYMDTCLYSTNLVSYEKEAILSHKALALELIRVYENP